MRIETPESSNVKWFDYAGSTMTVGFKFGVYEYYDVPQRVYDVMVKAESKGRFLNKNIKGNFEYKKID